jgi:hypothetical protein
VWIALDVLVIPFEYGAKELVLGVADGFDNEAVVTGVIEEGA